MGVKGKCHFNWDGDFWEYVLWVTYNFDHFMGYLLK